jgi:hypothetical protein
LYYRTAGADDCSPYYGADSDFGFSCYITDADNAAAGHLVATAMMPAFDPPDDNAGTAYPIDGGDASIYAHYEYYGLATDDDNNNNACHDLYYLHEHHPLWA